MLARQLRVIIEGSTSASQTDVRTSSINCQGMASTKVSREEQVIGNKDK